MGDILREFSDARSLPMLWKDVNGDGTQYALQVSTLGGGGGGSGVDREIVVNHFRVTTAFTGASVGDILSQMRVLDVSGSTPTQVGATIWFNDTTQLALGSAPSGANIEPIGASGVTNAQLVAALLTQTNTLTGTLATAANQATMIAGLASIDTKLTGNATDANITAVAGTKTTGSTALPAGGSGIIGWLSNLWQSFFGVASGTTDSGNPIKIGGYYTAGTLPTLTNGQRGDMQISARGTLVVSPDVSNTTVADAAPSSYASYPISRTGINLIPMTSAMLFNGSTYDRMRGDTNGSYAQGNVADHATDSGNPIKIGAVYTSSFTALTNGQRANLRVGTHGALQVVAATSGTTMGDAVSSNAASFNLAGQNSTDVFYPALGMLWNGASYDRMRGSTTKGLLVDTKNAVVVTALQSGVTTVVAGSSIAAVAGRKTFQAYGTTSAGTGAASINIEGSLDGTRWDVIGTFGLTLGTAAVSDSFTSDDRYAFVRSNVTTISGTTATVTVNMGS